MYAELNNYPPLAKLYAEFIGKEFGDKVQMGGYSIASSHFGLYHFLLLHQSFTPVTGNVSYKCPAFSTDFSEIPSSRCSHQLIDLRPPFA